MWEPNEREKKYLELIAVMTTDCMLGIGTLDRKTYFYNLETAIKQLKEEEANV